MARYGSSYYGSSYYGATPKLAYSVEPMSLTVLSFTTAFISWQSPTGDFSRIRLVRNQNGFSEHAEDGVIVWEEYAGEGEVSRSSFTDGVDNPLSISMTSGKTIYYTMFLFTSGKVWVKAGQISDVVPGNHDTQTKFINVLPRVFTSKEQSPFAEADTNSALYAFIDGFSFTLEEFLTYIDVLRPSHSRFETPASIVESETTHFGLTYEPNLPTRNQKKLIREAVYMYGRKGTSLGLGTYVESVTGFAPTITASENLLLSPQDSTFYNSTGNWTATNATLSSTDVQVPESGDNVIDTVYSCQIVATGSGTMSLGSSSPITLGVPVKGDTEYTYSAQVKSPTSAGNITLAVQWYDHQGTSISTDTSTTIGANNTWQQKSYTITSPENAYYAVLKVNYSASGTYFVDQVCMQTGATATYDEARAVDIFLDSNKVNYIKNPSFEDNTTDFWTLDGSATISQDATVSDKVYSGTTSALIEATGEWSYTTDDIPVISGNYYTFSAYIKTDEIVTVTFIGKDSLGNSTGHEETTTFSAQADWARITVTDLIDAVNEPDVAYYSVSFSGDAGDFYLDCIQFELTPVATDYFDGSLPSSFGAIWESTADNSVTHMYYNKDIKLQRLGQTLVDWLPMNTWWRVRTYAGLVYDNLTV